MNRNILSLIMIGVIMVQFTQAELQVRWNQAGYVPDREKTLIVMGTTSGQGTSWQILPLVSQGVTGAVALSGTLGGSLGGAGIHSPFVYHAKVDFTSLSAEGNYVFRLQGVPDAPIRITKDPYSKLIIQALRHLRVMRSGTADVLLRSGSHYKDSAAIVHVPQGDVSLGAWAKATPERKVSVQGGWYDAGDYIKFTLNEAYVAWHLLTAYSYNPRIHTKVYSKSTLPDILDEAKVGMDFLSRTLVDDNTFVIQVGNGLDHSQGTRLPESDVLDGNRPALCALSRVHMGASAAALALGAKVFKDVGQSSWTSYRDKAIAIFTRAQGAGTVRSAYEKDATNDFYYTTGDSAMMSLAASELYALTQDAAYLQAAKNWAPGVGSEVSWADWNFFANFRLGEWDAAAATRAKSQATAAATAGAQNIWGANAPYTWGTLHRFVGNAITTARVARREGVSDAATRRPFLQILDYVYGRSSWGVSFQFSKDLPNSVQNIYSQIYPLLDQFPVGALSEGPGEKNLHVEMEQWITNNPADPMIPYNTTDAVFYDNGKDFMTQESTIGGQGDLVLMLTLASDTGFTAIPDSGLGSGSVGDTPVMDRKLTLPANGLTWGTYTDASEGGTSTATAAVKSGVHVQATLDVKANAVLGYQYAGLFATLQVAQRPTTMTGLRIKMDLPTGKTLRVSIRQTDITDYDYWSKTLVGKGPGDYYVEFSKLEQQGFGAVKPFDPSKVNVVDLMNEAGGVSLALSVDTLEFYGTGAVRIARDSKRTPKVDLHRNGSQWSLSLGQELHEAKLQIFSVEGRIISTAQSNAQGHFHWMDSGMPGLRLLRLQAREGTWVMKGVASE